MRPHLAFGLFGLLAACAQRTPPACPVIADVVPASIDGGYVSAPARASRVAANSPPTEPPAMAMRV
ncbi:hypothetical protein [Polymorphobacter fuscus]|uniref:Uncharacterized protein n=1 Tax=Sandarakinorhabdus fusca TaxID=1439888 RepID=A0A7C9KLY5_9SPHN|nr:hypothetical protein [Polymorphobacter fuscus]KAB7646249.1 hypothetical protein F9290_09330 [Polymorphobacter fuscus]MQT17463.1 hypothetical protein [Polymorphobacter fuscus]NJC10000.1 hypothetical protein [Polymorphobacter fuscus]